MELMNSDVCLVELLLIVDVDVGRLWEVHLLPIRVSLDELREILILILVFF